MPFWIWSKTPAPNASVDPTINFAEGMSPSSVNDSCRAVMAAAAQYRDDISGSLITGGSSTVYTLTTNQGLGATPQTGQLIAFVPHATNGIAPTLTCDGGTAFPIQSAIGIAVSAATLVQGTPYTATFGGSAWLLRNVYGTPFNIPLGGMMPYLGSTAPNANFALPFGQAISRTTYATLFALIGTTFGVGDGVTTFNIPDLRDRAIFGLGNMGGADAGRITVAGGNFDGTVLGAVGGQENRTLTTAQIPAHTHNVTDPTHTHTLAVGTGTGGGNVVTRADNAGGAVYTTAAAATGISIQNAGGGGSHPTMPPCMMLPLILRII